MSDFLKMGLNRQNMAIEKATLRTDSISDAAYEVVTVTRNEALIKAADGYNAEDGRARTQRQYAVLPNHPSGLATDISHWYVENGLLLVVGLTTAWDELTFLVF